MQTDAGYRHAVEKAKTDWADFSRATAQQKLIINGTDTIFEIPIVIHVIHTGDPVGSSFNPTDQQLTDLIDFTNKCYQATWPAFPGAQTGGSYIPFQFTLAKRDPNCDSTTGIVRVDGSGLPGFTSNGIQLGSGPGVSETDVKALSRWPNNKYYNIWVVPYIGGPGGGTAGYAYYPGAGPAVDGTVILASVAQSGSSTLVHEIAHGMGLPHTFEGDNGGSTCPINNDCNVDGDGICDTEPHMRGTSCSDVTNPCTNAPYTFTRNSFMSYSHGCRDRFSNGQGRKMKYNLMNNRTALMHSDGATPPPPRAVNACIPVTNNPGSTQNYGPQQVVFHTINHASGGYDTEGILADNYCSGKAEVYTGSSYPISVTTGPNVEDVRVFIDFDNDGTFAFSEMVFSSNGSTPNQTHTGTVSIPSAGVVLCEPLRMRVISDIATNPFLLPCGPVDYGQAEDYIISVKPPSTATIAVVSSTAFPYCRDSAVTFTINTTNIPPVAPITWYLNGVPVGFGSTYTNSTLQTGDQIRVRTYVDNAICSSADTILSAPLTAAFLNGPPAPVISFINGSLVSNTSPVYWFGPNGLIPGVTGASYHPTQAGSYYAVAVGNPCPSDSSNVLNVALLDITDIDLTEIKLYPNPANEELIVETGDYKNLELTFYNTLGQMIIARKMSGSSNRLHISVRELVNGTYFLHIRDEEGRKKVMRVQIIHP